MDHVVAKDQRDAEARLRDGDVLRVSRSGRPGQVQEAADQAFAHELQLLGTRLIVHRELVQLAELLLQGQDRKSTRLNSSHLVISYAVFCLKKKIIIALGHVCAN